MISGCVGGGRGSIVCHLFFLGQRESLLLGAGLLLLLAQRLLAGAHCKEKR